MKEKMTFTEQEIKEQKQVIDELRQLVESKKAESAEGKEKIEKLELKLDDLENKNQKYVQNEVEAEKKLNELKDKINLFEKQIARMPVSVNGNEKSAHYKAWEKGIINGKDGLNMEELKYLSTDKNPQAGFLAPPEYIREITKDITEISPMRSIARVRQSASGTIQIPRRNGRINGNWVGEAGEQQESTSSYGMDVINTKELSVYTEVTHKMLHDAAFNIETEINADVVESFTQLEGRAFLIGESVNQPEGFLKNSDVTEVLSTNVGDLDGDDFSKLTEELKTGYNPVFLLNRRTIGKVRRLKIGNGEYLWQSGLAQSQPNTILGIRYIEMPDMETVASNAYPVAFGDFARGYTIVDGMKLVTIRDDVTRASFGVVRFNYLKSVGGKVTLPEAIVKLKIK
jgi:HK97 family phage major capsid protein